MRDRLRRRHSIGLTLALVALLTSTVLVEGCSANKPPNLTPAASTAFTQHRVQGVLDLIRDTAIDGEKQVPPVISTTTTRRIVTWHQSAITVLHASPAGWQVTVEKSLDEVMKDVTPAEAQLISPYVTMVRAVLRGVAP